MKKSSLKKRSVSAFSDDHVDEEAIRRRAYELYVDRGMEDGHDLEDWFHAEEEVTSRKSPSLVG